MSVNKVKTLSRKKPAWMETTDWIVSTLTKVVPTVNMLLTMINPEMKRVDFNLAAVAIAQAGLIQCLNPLSQGTTSLTRTGDTVLAKYIVIKGHQSYNNAACLSRFILVLDKEPDGALPAVTDVLTTADIGGHINLQNSNRFVIMKDWFAEVNNVGKYYTPIEVILNLNFHCGYALGNAGTIADIEQNSILFIQISNTAGANLTYRHRFAFYDN